MAIDRRAFCKAGMACTAALAPGAWAQGSPRYPTKTVTFVVPAPAGGPSDIMARLVAERLGPAIGQTVIVDNKAGAAQTLGTGFVARAEPDGHTLLFTTSTPIVIAPFTHKNLPYDVRRDLTVVSHAGSTPLVMYVHPSLGVSTLKEFVALAKSRPGEITYGSYGNGSSAHLLSEFLSRQAGIQLVHVPYKGVAPQVQDLVAGQINMAVADIGVPAPFMKSGKLKALAATGSTRSPQLPDVPTFAEQGFSGIEPFSPWWGLFAPAATPKPVVDKLSAEVARIVRLPELKERLASLGVEPTGTTAERGKQMLNAELAQWQKIVGSLSGVSFE
jgi:tripartite-type tricarboxylate transporter receptor subunit TctC